MDKQKSREWIYPKLGDLLMTLFLWFYAHNIIPLTIRSRTIRSRRSRTGSLQQNSIRSIQPSHENGLRPSDIRVRQESCSQRVSRNSSRASRDNTTRHLLSVCLALLVASTMHVSTRMFNVLCLVQRHFVSQIHLLHKHMHPLSDQVWKRRGSLRILKNWWDSKQNLFQILFYNIFQNY